MALNVAESCFATETRFGGRPSERAAEEEDAAAAEFARACCFLGDRMTVSGTFIGEETSNPNDDDGVLLVIGASVGSRACARLFDAAAAVGDRLEEGSCERAKEEDADSCSGSATVGGTLAFIGGEARGNSFSFNCKGSSAISCRGFDGGTELNSNGLRVGGAMDASRVLMVEQSSQSNGASWPCACGAPSPSQWP